MRSEWVVRVDGTVRARPAGTENPDLPTGLIELYITEMEVLGPAAELPMPVFGDQEYPEETRLTYRFLDLRREKLHQNIMKRGAIIDTIRRRMKDSGFFEFQTPILTASSPEGARDFLVPSRLHPGKFYALPQAPQQFKQLIMVAGFDRYFQIAPCFRDEDPRADRLPGEFYQLDVEMSFVTQEDVFRTMEPVIRGTFAEFAEGKPVTQTFPRIKYADAMLQYGSDKPDLRNPLVIVDVSEVFAREDVTFNAFKNVVEGGGVVRAIPATGAAAQPRSFFDKLNEWARTEGAPGLGYIVFERGERPADRQGADRQVHPAEAAGSDRPEGRAQGRRRGVLRRRRQRTRRPRSPARRASRIGDELGLGRQGPVRLLLDHRLPEYEWNEDEKKIDFSHNPFSMANMDHDAFMALDPTDKETILWITAFQYDMVCNGYEMASGAIRNHRPDRMVKAFEIAGYGEKEVMERFGGMFRAFQYGAPPHGGMAAGIDRIVMLLCGAQNLREITMFPMNQRAEDLLLGAPSEVTPKQLRELHIRLNLPEK